MQSFVFPDRKNVCFSSPTSEIITPHMHIRQDKYHTSTIATIHTLLHFHEQQIIKKSQEKAPLITDSSFVLVAQEYSLSLVYKKECTLTSPRISTDHKTSGQRLRIPDPCSYYFVHTFPRDTMCCDVMQCDDPLTMMWSWNPRIGFRVEVVRTCYRSVLSDLRGFESCCAFYIY